MPVNLPISTSLERAARSQVRRRRIAVWLATAACVSLAGEVPALANPTGGQVVGGTANITGQGGKTVTVNQTTNKAVINWADFSNAPGESVIFNQPGQTAATLNRVVGPNASQIMGSISANGQVYIVNGQGVLFGQGSQVNTAGLVVSTSGIGTQAFMDAKGTMRFDQQGNPLASIINNGSIVTQDAGMVAFVAPHVANNGLIQARYGRVAMGAANAFSLDLNGDGLISFLPGDQVAQGSADGKALVEAGGRIQAEGGSILLTASAARQVVNQSVAVTGLVSAAEVTKSADGVVHLGRRSGGGSVTVAGTGDVALARTAQIDASSATGQGGQVTVTGANITVDGAKIAADGATGGGLVQIGGGAQGLGKLAHAQTTQVSTDAVITADATQTGDGGHVVLWSDKATNFAGQISAQGGVQSGNGGMVETSSKVNLNILGLAKANARAASGKGGEWLLDPADITISSSASSGMDTSGTPWVATGSAGTIQNTTIQTALNAGTSVSIATTSASGTGAGKITVAANIAKTAGTDATLTLTADNNLYFNSGVQVTSTSGKLNMVFASNAGYIKSDGNTFTTNGGDFTMNSLAPSATAGLVSLWSNRNTAIWIQNGFNLNVGSGTATITGAQPNEVANNGNIGGKWQDSIWMSGTVNLTSTGSGSINFVANSGNWGMLLGWQSAIVLNSSGTTNFSATASGLTAQSGALWIGNYTITNNSGNLTFTGEGGSNYQTRGIYNNGNNNTLVNNSTGDITFNGNHSGYNASPWSAFEMYNTNATNNSSGNININGSNYGNDNGIYGYNDSFTNNSTGNINITGNNYGTGGWGVAFNGGTTNPASFISNGSGVINVSGVANNNTNAGTGGLLLNGGSLTRAPGAGQINVTGTNYSTSNGTTAVQFTNSSTSGDFTIVGNGQRGVQMAGTITNQSGNLIINGTGAAMGVGLGTDSQAFKLNNFGTTFTINGVDTGANASGWAGVWEWGPNGSLFSNTIATVGAITINGTSSSRSGIYLDRPSGLSNSSGGLILNGTSTTGYGFRFNTNYAPTINGVVTWETFTTSGNITVNARSTNSIGFDTDYITSWSNSGVFTVNATSSTNFGAALGWGGGSQTIANTGSGVLNISGTSTSTYGLILNGNQNFSFSGAVNLSGTSANSSGVYVPYYNSAYTYQLTNAQLTLTGFRTSPTATTYDINTPGSALWVGDSTSTLSFIGNSQQHVAPTYKTLAAVSFLPNALDYTAGFKITGAPTFSAMPSSATIAFGSAQETGATTINTPITLTSSGLISFNSGAGLTLTGAINATSAPVSLVAGGAITDTAGIASSSLSANAGGTINLSSIGNAFSTFAAATSSGTITVNDNSAMTISTLNGISGVVDQAGSISLSSLAGISILQPVQTNATSSTALTIVSGSAKSAGSVTGGDVQVSGNGTISVGSGGTARVFTGSVSGSTGLAGLGTQGGFRYDSTSTVSNYTKALSSGIDIIYREQPTLTSALTAPGGTTTRVYSGVATAPSLAVLSGTLNGDQPILSGTIIGGPALHVGSYNFTAANVTSDLGYRVSSPANMTYTITPFALNVTGLTATNRAYDGTTNDVITGAATPVGVFAVDQGNVAIGGSPVGTFTQDRHVGVGKTVAVTGLTLSGSAKNDYVLNSVSLTANITPFALGVTGITAVDKTYDGTAGMNVTGTPALSGLFNVDLGAVTVRGTASGALLDYHAGQNKVVSVSGLSLTGAAASDYSLPNPLLTANVAKAQVSVTGYGVQSKIYDGNANATITGTGAITNVLSQDAGSLVLLGTVSGAYADAHAGPSKLVTLSGVQLAGAAASDYSLSLPTLSGTITPRTLTVTGFNGVSRVYDGTTADTVSGTGALQGVLAGDTGAVSLSGAAVGTFSDRHVGISKAVAVSGITLSGPEASDYALTLPTVQANITPFALTVGGLTANDKVYDGTTSDLLTGFANLTNVFTVDAGKVTLTGTAAGAFADRHVGVAKAVTITGLRLTGAAASDYTLPNPVLNATITQAPLTVSGLVASNKVYDGTQTATVGGTGGLNGILNVDSGAVVLAGFANGAFVDRHVGSGKTITVSGLSLGGSAASDYRLVSPTLTGSISAATLTISGLAAADKVYDGTTAATVNGSAQLVGLYSVDNGSVSIAGTPTGAFAGRDVGSAKAVNLSGLNLTGANAFDYVLSLSPLSANITPAQISVTGLTANSKVYNGSTFDAISGSGQLSGVLTVDAGAVSLSGTASGVFADEHAGTAKPVSLTGVSLIGSASSNYVLSLPTLSADITAAPLTITGLVATSKVYNGSAAANITGFGTLNGLLNGDLSSVSLTGAPTGAFLDAHAGTNKTVLVSGLAISGVAARDYSLTLPTLSANITPASINLSGLSATSRTYDGTVVDALTGTPVLNGMLASDAATLSLAGAPTGVFTDRHVGVNKSVTITNVSLAGASSTDYTLTLPTLSATITPATATVTGFYASSKVYDGGTAANVIGAPVVNGLMPVDASTIRVGGTVSGQFADRHVGTAKAVTVSGVVLSGVGASDYVISVPSLTADITPAQLVVGGLTATAKVYDGTTSDVINGSATLNGVVFADSGAVSLLGAPTGTFNDRHVGYGKSVTVSGLSLGGPAAGDYALSRVVLAADITPATLQVSGLTVANKVYDSTTTADVLGAAQLSGVAAVDAGMVTVSGSATGTFADAHAGTGKVVTATGLSLAGVEAGDYQLAPLRLLGAITPRAVNVTGLSATDKVYDGTLADTITGTPTLSGVLNVDLLTLNVSGGALGQLADRHVGQNKAVTVTGLTLGGASAGDYALAYPGLVANVTPASLVITGLSALSKTYDGTRNADLTGSVGLSGVATVDFGHVAVNGVPVGTYLDANVGSAKHVDVSGLSLSGSAISDYVLKAANVSGGITPALLTVTADPASRIFGVANPTFTGSVTGFVAGETVTSATTGKLQFSSAATPTSNIGNYEINGTGLTANNGNYLIVQDPQNKIALTIQAPFTTETAGLVTTQTPGDVVLGPAAAQPSVSAAFVMTPKQTSPANDNLNRPVNVCNQTGSGTASCSGASSGW